MVKRLFTVGDRVESYRIQRFIARGLTTEVYLATHTGTGQVVALKCRGAGGPGPQAPSEAEFRAELRRLMGLCGLNVPAVLDGGVTGGVRWLATDFAAGTPLKIGPRYSVVETLAVALTILEALEGAHRQRGVVHGDLHPESLLDESGDAPVVVGIGCAALFGLNQDSVRDVPLYRAPEQVSGSGPVDVRSDIYSMGMILYAMLAQRPPFDDERGVSPRKGDLLALAERGGHELLTPLTAIRGAEAEPVWGIVKRAVHHDPAKRFQSWWELRSVIASAAMKCLSTTSAERAVALDALSEMHERQGTGKLTRYVIEAAEREEQPDSGRMLRLVEPLDPDEPEEARAILEDLLSLAVAWDAVSAGGSSGAGPSSEARPLKIVPAPPDVPAPEPTPCDTIPSPPCISEAPPATETEPPPSSSSSPTLPPPPSASPTPPSASPAPVKPEPSSAMSRLLRGGWSTFLVPLAIALLLVVIAVLLRAATDGLLHARLHTLAPMLPQELRPIVLLPSTRSACQRPCAARRSGLRL